MTAVVPSQDVRIEKMVTDLVVMRATSFAKVNVASVKNPQTDDLIIVKIAFVLINANISSALNQSN